MVERKQSLNADKTKYILFHKSTQVDNLPLKLPKLSMDSIQIERVEFIKFLGVLVDQNLSWDKHIKFTEARISRIIGLMYKIRPFLDSKSLKSLYFSLVHSHISYANIAWASTYKTKLSKLHSLQRHFSRIIYFKKRSHDAQPLMKLANILSVYKINIHQHLLLMHRFYNKNLPKNCTSFFTPVNNQLYNLRSNNKNQLKVPFIKNKRSEFFLRFRGPTLWNSREFQHINKEICLNTFKLLTKHHLLLN